MKLTRNIRLLIVSLVLSLAGGFCVTHLTGCGSSTVTLENGGVYTDAYLATTDRAILDAAKSLDGFVAWYNANSGFLSRYPEVGSLAGKVALNQNEWLRNAYAARDAYASAAAAYKDGKADAPSNAALNAALSVLLDVTKQINAYRAAHP